MSSRKEWQVFVSCKVTDSRGNKTRDWELARNIYELLKENSINAFMSTLSIIETGNSNYQEEIDFALGKAKVLIVVATSPDHLESGWVKHEWETFQNEVNSDRKRRCQIVVFVENIPVSSLPLGLRRLTVISEGPGALDQLLSFVKNALKYANGSNPKEVPFLIQRRKKKSIWIFTSIAVICLLVVLGALAFYISQNSLYEKLVEYYETVRSKFDSVEQEIKNAGESLHTVENLILNEIGEGLNEANAKLLEIRELRRKTMKTIEVLIQEGDFGDSEIRALYLIVNESYVEQDAIDELIDRYIKEKWEYQMTTHGLRNQIFECETKLIFFEDKMLRYRYEIEIWKRDFSKPDSLLLKLEEVKNGVNEVQSKISQVLSEIQELKYEPL